jgi:hypothetical protein
MLAPEQTTLQWCRLPRCAIASKVSLQKKIVGENIEEFQSINGGYFFGSNINWRKTNIVQMQNTC